MSSYPHRFVPPIYPRPNRANSLLLDLLEFPLATADPGPDVLLKCDLDNVLDVSNGHDTPAGAQQQIYPLPNGQDDAADQDVAKMKQSQDPDVLEEVAAFPAAVFTSTTISASRPAPTASTSNDVPNLVVQRGGRTSQFSAKQRRERHNANERRRTNAAKDRIRDMRDSPMTSDAAFNWVKDSYSDIMALKDQQKLAESAATSVLGWREDKREVTKFGDESSLELMMTQDFPGIVSGELVFNTWNLLTVLEAFQKIFPLTKDLAVLQTINDDCVIVRIGIAPTYDAPVVHSIVVLARGQIDGGYLVSMRSVPLSAGQKAFAAGEETYLPVLAWFMLLDKYDECAQPVCEVIVGASAQHMSKRVLQSLANEVVAGVVRWQEAVGQSKHWLL
ncbi:uncharacterized protein PITG_18813 [Phytophthora infestans T30-4]|uniref:Uncharacterized protein n=1 Tax=Phytophthora infestans (strain T30-4) TaxID=403677 RepID=D0NZG1_PHYIT|nr:uncharacterized protein PITG_18813 [Phytophthora infestans T30-4]EEY69515.1 conserved hypothetical protein [Phytophthora infestans T30-4]|eukprot:XP_002997282.1 conserved hypothetical protein [Phytophthora infestans T30-4]